MTFAQYCALWGDLWPRRGRGGNDLIMMREDWHGDWSLVNSMVADRSQYSYQLVQIKLERGTVRGSTCTPGRIHRRGRDL